MLTDLDEARASPPQQKAAAMLSLIITLQLAMPQPALPADTVRQIDWRNVALEGDIQLTDGQWSLEVDPGIFETVDLESVVYADVTGDGVDEAVLLTTYHSADAAPVSSVQVYGVRGAEPVLVAELPTIAPIHDFRIEAGAIVVSEGRAEALRATTWRVRGRRAVRVAR